MTFLFYEGHWYEFNLHEFECYNYRGGWFNPDENKFGDALIKEYKSWHELYMTEHYDPTILRGRDQYANDVWISPLGSFHWGEGHAVQAGYIAHIWYGWDEDEGISVVGNYECAERVLEEHGWIKCSRFFWNMHLNERPYWEMNLPQFSAVREWCDAQGIEFPEDDIYIKEWLYK